MVCGIPLEATDSGTCAPCLVKPPIISRTRAAVEYGDIAASVAIRLKYGRKIALAKSMARFMSPLLGEVPDDALLVPVPLHRRRLAARGFNQSLLIARELGRLRELEVVPRLLRRKRATPPLRGMNLAERQRTVAGVFEVPARCDGRTLILIDDVLTTGSTTTACAKALKRGGAEQIILLCWSRVVRNPIFAR